MIPGNFRAFGPLLPVVRRPMLGGDPPAVIDKSNGLIPKTIGEPPLEAALARLAPDEVEDYQSWGPKEKVLFLAGYQYLATATAAGLQRLDGTPFDGYLTQGLSLAMKALQTIQDLLKLASPEFLAAVNKAADVLDTASGKTEPRALEFVKKYQLLRDRVAWELAAQYEITVEFEILGTDPANRGMVYTRKIGDDRAPDYSAVFSTMTPSEFYKAGLELQDKYEAQGVTFKKLNALGAVNPRMGVGPALILAIAITAVVAILSFFWLWNRTNEQTKLLDQAVELIQKDPRLTDQEKADRLLAIRRADSFFGEVLGSGISWVTVLLALGAGALAVLAFPYIKKAVEKKTFFPSLGQAEGRYEGRSEGWSAWR